MKHYLLPAALLLPVFLLPLQAQTVYLNQSGDKTYHASGCKVIRKNNTAIDLQEAIHKGNLACKICKPAQDITGNTLKQKHLDEKQDPETNQQPRPSTNTNDQAAKDKTNAPVVKQKETSAKKK